MKNELQKTRSTFSINLHYKKGPRTCFILLLKISICYQTLQELRPFLHICCANLWFRKYNKCLLHDVVWKRWKSEEKKLYIVTKRSRKWRTVEVMTVYNNFTAKMSGKIFCLKVSILFCQLQKKMRTAELMIRDNNCKIQNLRFQLFWFWLWQLVTSNPAVIWAWDSN